MDAIVNGSLVRFTARNLLGQGGEAEVFDLGDGRVLKRFKAETHADYAGLPAAQMAAAARLKEHEEKLPALMRLALPPSVIGPLHLAHSKSGLVGYTMRKIDSAVTLADQMSLRKSVGGAERNLMLLKALQDVVHALHSAGVVLGDFNDNNVLVRGDDVFCIDADSYQFGRFTCHMFSERFVDPRLCSVVGGDLQLVRPHTESSDWFAFTVMAMQLLLLVGPFGGVYKPKDASKRLPPSHRALEGISVFHGEVQYPKPAIALRSLPDELLSFFENVAVRSIRAPVPLDSLRFTRCLKCNNEHARNVCPFCTQATIVSHRVAIRGRVRAQMIYRTEGTLVAVAAKDQWLAHEAGAFVREDRTRVLSGAHSAGLKFALTPGRTLVGQGNKIAIIENGTTTLRSIARGAFATHGDHAVFVSGEALVRLSDAAPFAQDEVLGSVLENDAHVWLGPSFGLGLYRAGELAVGYTFSPTRKGITDSLRPLCVRGRVLSVGCALGELAWLTVVREEAGRAIHTCLLIDSRGAVLASAEDDARNTPWLASAARGAAVGQSLLVPTDAGLARIEASGNTLVLTHLFDATEPFVDADCSLIPSASSLLVFDAHELRALTMEVP